MNVPGVHLVPSYSNAYIIDGDEGVTLIDTGPRKKDDGVRRALAAAGRGVDDVRLIAITHAHSDHTGSAKVLQHESLAKVAASAVEAPAIAGVAAVAPPPVFQRFFFLRPFFRFVKRADPVDVDLLVGESDVVGLPGYLRVIETPGHTPGHVSYLLDRAGGVLFVGDAAVANRRGEVRRGLMNASTPAFDASLRHIAEFDFEVALFAHSRPITTGASGAFRAFVTGLT